MHCKEGLGANVGYSGHVHQIAWECNYVTGLILSTVQMLCTCQACSPWHFAWYTVATLLPLLVKSTIPHTVLGAKHKHYWRIWGFMVRWKNHAWKWKLKYFHCQHLVSGNQTKSLSFSLCFFSSFSFIDWQKQVSFCLLLPIHYHYRCNIAIRIILMIMDLLWWML